MRFLTMIFGIFALLCFVVASPQDLGKDLPDGVKVADNIVNDVLGLIKDIKMLKSNSTNKVDQILLIKDHLQDAIHHGLEGVADGKKIIADVQNLIKNGGTSEDADTIVHVVDSITSRWLPISPVAPNATSVIHNDAQQIAQIAIDVKNDITNLVKDMQLLAQGAEVNATLLLSIKDHVQQAIAHGLNNIEGSKDIIKDIQKIIDNKGIDLRDSVAVVNDIQAALQKVLGSLDPAPRVCLRDGVGRGVGVFAENQCQPGEEAYGALCYPKCKEGYERVGCCICRKKGCSGAQDVTDIGASCTKPKAYGRGVGYALWNKDKCDAENAQGCEKNGAMWYPKCKPGFHAFGCCICTPDCPTGTHDDGAFCRKDHYGRGAGASRLGCKAGLDKSGFMCYPPCSEGYNGVGPMCWPKCGGDAPFSCGLFCTSTAATCASSAVDIIGGIAKVALSAVNKDTQGAISNGVQTGSKIVVMEHCKKM
nr:secreted protein [Thraustotheca clavata]